MVILDFWLFSEKKNKKKSNLAHRTGPGQMYKCLKNMIPLQNCKNGRSSLVFYLFRLAVQTQEVASVSSETSPCTTVCVCVK